MRVRQLLLLSLAVFTLTVAGCSSNSTAVNPSSSPAVVLPSATPVTITLSAASVKIGGTFTITGSGFNARRSTSVVIVQNGKAFTLVATTVNVQANGSFTLPAAVPSDKGLSTGPAFVNACSYDKNPGDTQCSRATITLTN